MPSIPPAALRAFPVPDNWLQCKKCLLFYPRNELDGKTADNRPWNHEDPIPAELSCIFCDQPHEEHPHATKGLSVLEIGEDQPELMPEVMILDLSRGVRKEYRRAMSFGSGIYVYFRDGKAHIYLRAEVPIEDVEYFKNRLLAAEEFIRMGAAKALLDK